MGTNLLGELAANNGTYFLFTDGYTGNIDQIIVRSDNTAPIKIQIYVGDNENVTDTYLQGGQNCKLINGMRITPKNNDVFTRVQIISNDADMGGLELVLA